ncbi:unnamed protein product [Peniophora sp. CBMAI 1063]|nr:unnamed protein product [Peniophora sp. CBMAI 1063]
MTGSFRPLNAHEWAAQTYVRAQERLVEAAAANDVRTLKALIADIQQRKQAEDADIRVEEPEAAKAGDSAEEPLDLDARDCTGRTPLHVAILAGARGSALELIDAGARMAPRLVGGRTSLHLAAQAGMDVVVQALLARSERNRAEAEAKGTSVEAESMAVDDSEGEQEEGSEGESTEEEEEWEQVKRSDARPTTSPSESADALEDPPADAPDILDLTAPDWDFGFSPLIYAILAGSLSSVNILLEAGAPADKPTKNGLHPLAATIFTRESAAAAEIARALVEKGASCTVADGNWLSILHLIVATPGRSDVVRALLESDTKGARAAQDASAWQSSYIVHPFGTAVATGNYAAVAVLAAFGAKMGLVEEDVSRAVDTRKQRAWIGNAKDWREWVHHPLEAALARGEGIEGIKMLLSLGVKADAPPRAAIELGPEDDVGRRYASLADWAGQARKAVDAAIKHKTEGPKDTAPASSTSSADPSQATSWTEWRAAMIDIVKSLRLPENYSGPKMLRLGGSRGDSDDGPLEKRSLPELERMHDHYVALEALLREQPGVPPAPTFEEKVEEKKEKKEDNEYIEYRRLDRFTAYDAVPSHLRARYDKLYEAAWTGDNKTIQEFCVSGEEPIQIAVMATNAHPHGDIWPGRQGYTPLMVAIERRHWDTAKLILSIAEAQHKPDDAQTSATEEEFSDDESESESMDIDEEDPEPKPIDFTDIAARPSKIQCRASPSDLLDIEGGWPADGKLATATALQRTVYDGDIDTFKHILELYQHAKVDPAGKWATFGVILRQDRPEFLDAYIRKTGSGIYPSRTSLPTIELDTDDADGVEVEKKKRVYLGLDWHGVKHSERGKIQPVRLALGPISSPTARQAADHGSLKVLEYLSSSRPLAAYRAFITAHPDKKSARDIMNAKFSGLTPLLAAVRAGVKPELFDFLIERGAEPADRDARGWNAFHILSVVSEREQETYEKYETLAKHLVQKLPQELVLSLLAQQSRGALNTPLALAVKKDRPSLLALFISLPLPDSIYLSRDASASTALHAAAQRDHAHFVRALTAGGPAELLHAENGVGQTATEVAGLRLLNKWTETGSGSLPSLKWDLPIKQSDLAKLEHPRPDKSLRRRTEELRHELDVLLQTGKLNRSANLGKALLAFAEALEAKLPTVAVDEGVKGNYTSQGAVEETYWILFDAARARPTKRGLVHVLDVQRSVEHNVRQAALDREEEKAAYAPYQERVDSIDDQLKDASIFKEVNLRYMNRRIMRGNGSINWFVDVDEVY